MFKIAEYRPDKEGNRPSIWAGNLSFTGKSSGMSVHLLTGTCARFQQLLTGNAGRGPGPSQQGAAAPAPHAVALERGKPGNVLPFEGTGRQMPGHLSGTCTVPVPSPLGGEMRGCTQEALGARALTRVWAVVWPHGDCRTHKRRKDSRHTCQAALTWAALGEGIL